MELSDALGMFPSADAFIITDISRDGMLQGPDLDGLTRVSRITSTPVIASGGVSSLADVAALGAIEGIAGVITGKALYEGRFSVADALACLGWSGSENGGES
jgi:phosphoribosylformimino-5-aminoimidazole carboxamide ribonucleotide (ProFAR) isomerase